MPSEALQQARRERIPDGAGGQGEALGLGHSENPFLPSASRGIHLLAVENYHKHPQRRPTLPLAPFQQAPAQGRTQRGPPGKEGGEQQGSGEYKNVSGLVISRCCMRWGMGPVIKRGCSIEEGGQGIK